MCVRSCPVQGSLGALIGYPPAAAGGVHNLQVDPGRRIAYGMGPGFQQVQPMAY